MNERIDVLAVMNAAANLAKPGARKESYLRARDAVAELIEAAHDIAIVNGAEPYSYLDRGIGTKTNEGNRWLRLRAALARVGAP